MIMNDQRIVSPTDDHDQTQQPMETENSYQDTVNGTKYSVAETVEIGQNVMLIEQENNTIQFNSGIKLEEVNYETSAHIDRLISNNEQYVSSPRPAYTPEDQEDYDSDLKEIREAITSDIDKIPVKKMRKLVPKMRMAVYMTQDEIKSKRKHKHLWDERPQNWEAGVPFKDPNNKSGQTGKPGKEVLTKMFDFLKKKFIEKCIAGKLDDSLMEESFQVHQPSEETVPAIAQEQEAIIIETSPVQAQQPIQNFQPSQNAEVNDPVSGLYRRIEQKIVQVEAFVAEHQDCREALHQVFQDIIKSLYIQSKAVTMCGYFLDAGHDLENLLDKGLAFGQLLDASVIKQGCLMICKKYAATQRCLTANLQNVETPIFHVKEEVTAQSTAARAQALRQTSIPARMSQTVSDDCSPPYIKQEPASPGVPFSPATDLANQMQDVNLKDCFDPKYFGIDAKNGNHAFSSLVDIRKQADDITELCELAKDRIQDAKQKSGQDSKSGERVDMLQTLMNDIFSPETSAWKSTDPQMAFPNNGTDPLPQPNQQMINQTIRMTQELNGQQLRTEQVINDVNLNTTVPDVSEDDLFAAVLSLEDDFPEIPTEIKSQMSMSSPTAPTGAGNNVSCQPTRQVVQTALQFNPHIQNPSSNQKAQNMAQTHQSPTQTASGVVFLGQQMNSVPSTATYLPTTLMDIMDSDGEDAGKKSGGGKVMSQRRRAVRRGKGADKGKDKYSHV